MFSMQFRRFVWKEWRIHRGLWFSCLGMGVATLLLVVMLLPAQLNGFVFASPWVQFFPCMYALGCGALLFAGEREERTVDWLHRLPVNPRALLSAKFSFAVASTIAVQWLLAFLSTLLMVGVSNVSLYDLRSIYFPNGLIVLLWSILGSLCSRRVLISIPAIGCWIIALGLLPIAITQQVTRNLQQTGHAVPFVESALFGRIPSIDFWACVVLLLTLVTVCVLDIWLAWRWCHEKYLDASVVERLCTRLVERFKPWLPARRVSAVSIPKVEYEDSWRRTWQRLIWQERRRESAQRVILIAGCVIAVLFVLAIGSNAGFHNEQRFRLDLAIMCGTFYLSMIPVTMGVFGFRCDADHQQPRFLANRGISPATLWLAKQAVWLPRAFWIPAAILCAAAIATVFTGQLVNFLSFSFQALVVISHPLHGDPLRAIWHATFGLIEFVLLGYCCGQLAALVCQRTIIAFVLAFALNVVAFIFQLGIAHFDIPAWWALGIPIAALLAITLWQSRAWMLDDQSWQRWRRLSVAIASILIFLGVTLPAYRVAEAMVAMPFGPQLPIMANSDWKTRRTPVEQSILQQMSQLGRTGWGDSSEQADDVVRLMQGPVNSLSSSGLEQTWLTQMHHRMHLRSDILLSTGHPAESWDCLMTSLKVARCFARDGNYAAWLTGIAEQEKSLEQIMLWIGRSELTLPEIEEKRQAIADELQQFPSISESVLSNYRENRQFMVESDQLLESVGEFGHRSQNGPRDGIDLLAIKLPSERKRLDLVLRQLAQVSFYFATRLQTQGTDQNRFNLPLPTWLDSIVQTTPLIGHAGWHPDQVPVMFNRRQTVVHAALTRMALISYRKTHGRLPERLMELSALVPPAALIDPNSNHEFEYYPAILVSQSPQRIEVQLLSSTEVELKQVGRYPVNSVRITRDLLLSQDPAQIQALQKAIKELGYVFPIPVAVPTQQ